MLWLLIGNDCSECTFDHLLSHSGHGDTIVGMLTDVVSFWTYENREANAQKIPEELSHA